jgi:UPF0755 protein
MSMVARIVSIVLVVLIALGGVVAWQALRFVRTPVSQDDTLIVFNVKQGQTLRDVATKLEEEKLITDARKFRAFVRIKSLGSKVRTGEYALKRNMSPMEILKILSSGRSIEYVVTISEGLNRFEIAAIVDRLGIGTKAEFLRLTQDREFIQQTLGDDIPTLEGYLFPETYYVTRASGVRGLVRQMVAKFNESFAQVPSSMASDISVPLKKHQVVTLASIVEKETGSPEERPLISSVFHNRMRKGMKLQTDPTVIYGIWVRGGVWNRNISRQDLITPSPYNTYVIPGLPPGPIANPGLPALRAAVRPAKSEFLFFVSRNDGTHVFSRDYGQHRTAVGDYQLNKKARDGKSWRDLSKKNRGTPSATPRPNGKAVTR